MRAVHTCGKFRPNSKSSLNEQTPSASRHWRQSSPENCDSVNLLNNLQRARFATRAYTNPSAAAVINAVATAAMMAVSINTMNCQAEWRRRRFPRAGQGNKCPSSSPRPKSGPTPSRARATRRVSGCYQNAVSPRKINTQTTRADRRRNRS